MTVIKGIVRLAMADGEVAKVRVPATVPATVAFDRGRSLGEATLDVAANGDVLATMDVPAGLLGDQRLDHYSIGSAPEPDDIAACLARPRPALGE